MYRRGAPANALITAICFLDISMHMAGLATMQSQDGRYAGMLAIAAFRDRSIRIERLLCDDRKAERHNLHNSPKPRVR